MLRTDQERLTETSEALRSRLADALRRLSVGASDEEHSQHDFAAVQLGTSEIAERTTPSVVVIEKWNQDGQVAGQGSGYVAAPGVIVTNYHVIRGARSITIRAASGALFATNTILAYSVENDLAALHVSSMTAPILQSEGARKVRVGDRVVAIGNPLGLENTVSEGIVSGLRDTDGIKVIQTTACISPGSSGGPLVNNLGRVVGVTAAGLDGQNLNFAIHADHITNLLIYQRRISLEQMLTETRVVESLPADTVSVPAGDCINVEIIVQEGGAVLQGTYKVKGGISNDIEVLITDLNDHGEAVFSSGRVKECGELKQELRYGRYSLVFSNEFSTFSQKSVTSDLQLTYYR